MTDPLTLSDYKNLFYGGGSDKELEFYKQAVDSGLDAFDLLNPVSPRPSTLTPYLVMSRGSAGFAFNVGDLRVTRVWLPKGILDGLTWEIIAGTATSMTRALVYETSSSDKNRPGNLLVDSGQVDSSVAGLKSVVGLATEVQYEGWYWAGVVNQVAAASILFGGSSPAFQQSFQSAVGNMLKLLFAWRDTTITGAPPATWTAPNNSFEVNAPTVAFKYTV